MIRATVDLPRIPLTWIRHLHCLDASPMSDELGPPAGKQRDADDNAGDNDDGHVVFVGTL